MASILAMPLIFSNQKHHARFSIPMPHRKKQTIEIQRIRVSHLGSACHFHKIFMQDVTQANEKYVGDLCQKKTITPNYLTHAKKYNHGEEEMVYLREHHEPIIERSLWERTQKELSRRKGLKKKKERYSNRYWCSGKVFCGVCGRQYVSRYKNLKNGTRYQGWRCYTAVNYGVPKQKGEGQNIGCKNLQMNNQTLLFCMKFCISHIQNNKESLKEEILHEIRQLKKITEKETAIEKFQKRIESISNKKKKAIDLVLEGIITAEEMKEQNSWYNEELDRLAGKLEQAKKENNIYIRQIDGIEQYARALDEIMDFQEYNEILYQELLEKIYVYPDNRLDVWLKILPFGIHLKFRTSGKGNTFCVEVLEMVLIQNGGHFAASLPISVSTALPIS